MAQIVAGVGVPHTPAFPANVDVGDKTDETSRYFQNVADQLAEEQPDVLVMFDSDHLNTFFLDNMPMISIGVAPRTAGPNDGTPGLGDVDLLVPEALGVHVRGSCVDSRFDVSLTQEFTVDHSILVPLHYLTPQHDIPVLPIFVNGLVPPLPAADRCLDLGRAVGAAIRDWPDDLRVAIVASGSFSLDVGGPHIRPDQIFGVPAEDWVVEVSEHLTSGDVERLVARATPPRIATAGNVGGELLNWIAMLGAIGTPQPASLDLQTHLGHGYGFWKVAP
ncbi:hypothetical protein [Streptomyces sp. NPDC055105]|uniref:DODA-type extradiol aromatic ring-opening family dioxygenase n=1 Tax=Streptomyces sp. NPDC055105 TaxID=3365719 RepID=UPI0037D818B1